MITQATINHTLQQLHTLAATRPNGMSDTLDYLNDSRHTMQTAANHIEQLNEMFLRQREATNAFAYINSAMHTIVENKAEHEPGCIGDPRKYPTDIPFDCPACELLAIARHVDDFEQLPDVATLRWIATDAERIDKNAHLL
jgi:hypothetical protein